VSPSGSSCCDTSSAGADFVAVVAVDVVRSGGGRCWGPLLLTVGTLWTLCRLRPVVSHVGATRTLHDPDRGSANNTSGTDPSVLVSARPCFVQHPRASVDDVEPEFAGPPTEVKTNSSRSRGPR